MFIWKAAENKSSVLQKLFDEDDTLDYGCVDHYNFNTDLMLSEQRMFNQFKVRIIFCVKQQITLTLFAEEVGCQANGIDRNG